MSAEIRVPPWFRSIKVVTKKGEEIPLVHAIKDGLLDEVDFLKPAYLYEKPLPHDLVLLAVSAERYPVIIEQMMKKMREVMSR
jgi:hypothetical protein